VEAGAGAAICGLPMKLTERILRQLNEVRDRSEKLLIAFRTPEDWTYQLAPGTNHALWFAGHMAACDNWLIGIIAPEQAKEFEDWYRLFGTGSQPTADPDNYPPAEQVLEAMRDRRKVLLEILNNLSDEELAQPAPEAISDWCPDVGSIFEGSVWHEAMHAGQITLIRRTLGHKPLF
jgi:DinB family protein